MENPTLNFKPVERPLKIFDVEKILAGVFLNQLEHI